MGRYRRPRRDDRARHREDEGPLPRGRVARAAHAADADHRVREVPPPPRRHRPADPARSARLAARALGAHAAPRRGPAARVQYRRGWTDAGSFPSRAGRRRRGRRPGRIVVARVTPKTRDRPARLRPGAGRRRRDAHHTGDGEPDRERGEVLAVGNADHRPRDARRRSRRAVGHRPRTGHPDR